jgi:hypothetical protein
MQGVHPPPKFGAGIGISSLNKTIINFLTVHAIFAQNSSIYAIVVKSDQKRSSVCAYLLISCLEDKT